MAKKRWTFEEIRTISNRDFILRVLDERGKGLNPVSPLKQKCQQVKRWFEKVVPVDGIKPVAGKPATPPPAPSAPALTQVSDDGAKQAEFIAGLPAKEKEGQYRKPDNIRKSHHRAPVIRTEQQEDRIIAAYLATDEHGKRLNKTTDIEKAFTVSPGELYRILHRRKITPERLHGQKGLPLEPKQPAINPGPSTPKTKLKTAYLGAVTEASRYLFTKTRRKKWANLVQKEEFEKCEAEVGAKRMIEAIDWALISGISNIKSMITAARKGSRRLSV